MLKSGSLSTVLLPVHLYRAPLSPPAAMLPKISCCTRMWSIDEWNPLYTRGAQTVNISIKQSGKKVSPSTPAELPIHETRRVTAFNTAFKRNLEDGVASGRLNPSLNPHTPPRPRPKEQDKED